MHEIQGHPCDSAMPGYSCGWMLEPGLRGLVATQMSHQAQMKLALAQRTRQLQAWTAHEEGCQSGQLQTVLCVPQQMTSSIKEVQQDALDESTCLFLCIFGMRPCPMTLTG